MRSKETSTRILFVRHGQTDFPLDRIYCDEREDPELNRNGRLQAKSAAVFFQDLAIDALYVSPLRRTRMTAAEIAEVTGAEPQLQPDLMERRFGIWEGLYFDQIEREHPEDHLRWKQDPVNFAPAGGETVPQLVARVGAVVDDIVSRHRGGTVVVVTHVGPIRVLVTRAFDIPLPMYRQLRIDYASITCIDYGETRNNLIFLNKTQYRTGLSK